MSSGQACQMAIQYQHHHHFFSHHAHPTDMTSSNIGQQLPHPHQQGHQHQHLHHHFPTTTASAMTTGTTLTSIGSLSNESSISSSATESSQCCTTSSSSCRCSNRLLTGIVITILPIAITSTLICVFMMQKTNLHQYAIYSFVIFCAAFVFPFALFFLTVILNKIYKFYKREIRSIPRNALNSLEPENCDADTGSLPAADYSRNMQSTTTATNGPGCTMLINNNLCNQTNGTGQNASLICYSSRASFHPYYYHIDDGTIVAYAPENSVIIEDSPPSYEMALLCPSVTHHQYPGSFINGQFQVILPKEQNKEKSSADVTIHQQAVADTPTTLNQSYTASEIVANDEHHHQDEEAAIEDHRTAIQEDEQHENCNAT